MPAIAHLKMSTIDGGHLAAKPSQRQSGRTGRLPKVDALEDQNQQIMKDLRQIRETLAGAKGGWRTLVAVAGIAGTAGAILSKIAPLSVMLPK